MKKNKFLIFLILSFLFNNNLLANNNLKLENKIFKNLRCLICQGQSVYDSQSDFAESVKIVVRNKLESGKNEQEIYSFLKAKYGDWILYDPEIKKNTLLLWLIPLFIFLIGGLLILRKLVVLKK
mgnify:CR=1 FL=1|tara:strand:- start:153 stop:524 length:372 start_codon:yes stop_codon:yes gene_type:complete